MKKILLPVVMGIGVFTLAGCVESETPIDIRSFITSTLENEVIYEEDLSYDEYILKSDELLATKSEDYLSYDNDFVYDYVTKEDGVYYNVGALNNLNTYKFPISQEGYDKLLSENIFQLELIDSDTYIDFDDSVYSKVDEFNHEFEVEIDEDGELATYTFEIKEEIITGLKIKSFLFERDYNYKFGDDVPTISEKEVVGELFLYETEDISDGHVLAMEIRNHLEDNIDDTFSITIVSDIYSDLIDIQIGSDEDYYYSMDPLNFDNLYYFIGVEEIGGHLINSMLVPGADIIIMYNPNL